MNSRGEGVPDERGKPEAAGEREAKARTEPAVLLQRLVENQVLMPSERVLCYGCGRGADVAWLRMRRFKSVTGYDPYPPFGYATEPTGYFDVVQCIYLMRRLKTDKNRRETVRKAFQFVRPGGRLIIISRNWVRLAAEVGENTRDGAIASLSRFLDGCDVAEVETPVFSPDDREVCLVARRAGMHEPQYPYDWVDQPEQLAAACTEVARHAVAGLDVETTLDEPRTLCTVQLGVHGRTFIIDALALHDLSPLKAVMEDPHIEKVIHNASFEEQMLGGRGIRIRNIFDTLDASRKKHRKGVAGGHKLNEVCERELQVYLDKALQTSDWTQRPLTREQLAYAALDAEVLLALYDVFHPPAPPETMPLF
jgi:SAM-dependent methyltransferase